MPLVYSELSPFVPCGDGSPAGIYHEPWSSKFGGNSNNKNKHVLVFGGGGGCLTEEDCQVVALTAPYLVSSKYALNTTTGSTILSNSPSINPTMYDYNKWFVPYCSQDLWLGAGTGQIAGLERAGSIHVTTVLEHILTNTSVIIGGIEELVVVGISAGTMAVVNHMPQLRNLVAETASESSSSQQQAGNKLKVILDSSMFYDHELENPVAASNEFVDYNIHPLCDEDQYGQPQELSKLPCCISIHCHIEHGLWEANSNSSSGFVSSTNNNGNTNVAVEDIYNGTTTAASASAVEESFLLFDSRYDALVSLQFAMAFTDDRQDVFANDLGAGLGLLFGGTELAGSRDRAARDSLLLGQRENGGGGGSSSGNPSSTTTIASSSPTGVAWAIPSCWAHPLLVPSQELSSHYSCQVQQYGADYYAECDDESVTLGMGVGHRSELRVGQKLSTRTWEIATAGPYTVKNLIEGFVSDGSRDVPFAAPLFPINADDGGNARIFITDDCAGPNCVPWQDATGEPHSCQELLVVEHDQKPVPASMQVILGIFFVLSILSFFFRFRRYQSFFDFQWLATAFRNGEETDDTAARTNRKSLFFQGTGTSTRMVKQTIGIKMENLSASTKTGQQLLSNVNFELEPGTVTGLLGRSGSGKSTLLGAISGQMRPGCVLSMDSDIQVNIDSTTFLRQHDNVNMENLSAMAFLRSSADVYGASDERLAKIAKFIHPFFPKRVHTEDQSMIEDSELDLPDPFETTLIKNCSGGQRRVLAVGAALLTSPTVLLLDEPLSGLDSVASERLMTLLRLVAAGEDLTVLVIVHQPSDEIIDLLDGIMCMEKGRIVLHEPVFCLQRALKLDKFNSVRISEFIHKLVKTGKLDEGSSELIEQGRNIRLSMKPKMRMTMMRQVAGVSFRQASFRNVVVKEKKKCGFFPHDAIAQVLPLSRRLYLEYGDPWTDLLVLPVCSAIISSVASIRPTTPIQIAMTNMWVVMVPVIIFQHHNVGSTNMWFAHRTELDDRRISCASYYIASMTFSFCVPLFSTMISVLVSFGMLGWPFSGFLVSYLFAALYFLIMMEIGRVISLVFSGRHVYWNVYLLILFLDFILSGILASPGDASPGASWFFALSLSHWTWSGSTLALLGKFEQLGDSVCTDAVSCLLVDDSFVKGASGFTYFSTPFRSMMVLLVCFILLGLAEYALLRKRRTHFVSPNAALKQGASKEGQGDPTDTPTAFNEEEETSHQETTIANIESTAPHWNDSGASAANEGNFRLSSKVVKEAVGASNNGVHYDGIMEEEEEVEVKKNPSG